jgi:hypothetical protein
MSGTSDRHVIDQAELAGGVARLLRTAGGAPTLEMLGAGVPSWRATFPVGTRLLASRIRPEGLEFTYAQAPGAAVPGHGELEVTVRLVGDDGPDTSPGVSSFPVTLSFDVPMDFPFEELAGPSLRPMRPTTTAADWHYLVPDGEGLLLRGEGQGFGWRDRLLFNDLRVTLPMTALIHASGASLLVTAVDGQDHAIDLASTRDGAEAPGLGLVQLPALGRWAYSREWRVVTAASGGVAGLAETMREELRRGGIRLRQRSAKLAERGVPSRIHDSAGGTVLWCHFDTLTAGLVRALEQESLRGVRLMGRPADAAAGEALQRSPYASGPYFQTFDVFPPGSVTELGWRGTYPPEGASDGWPENLIRDLAGWFDPAWTYLAFPAGERFWSMEDYLAADGTVQVRRRYQHGQVPVLSYRRCPSKHRSVVEARGLPMLEEIGASAVFFDIATAMWGLECYSPEHPCDRRADRDHRIDALGLLGGTQRLVYSEAGKWWGIDHVDGFEGLLSYDQELNEDNIQLTDYPEDTGRWAYEFNLEHRVPFFGMVARDAVTRTMWWGTGQDRHLSTWGSKDALTALYAANPIFVVDPDHPLEPATSRWSRFTATARAFDALNELSPDARILHHENDGPDVGWTELDGGVTIEANVGRVTHGELAPGEFVVRDGSGVTVVRVRPSMDD